MEEGRYRIADRFVDYLAEIGFATGIAQRLFGDTADELEFLSLSTGIVSIRPVFAPGLPHYLSDFPLEGMLFYRAKPKEGHEPWLRKGTIEYQETIRRYTQEEMSRIEDDQDFNDTVASELERAANSAIFRIRSQHHREAELTWEPRR